VFTGPRRQTTEMKLAFLVVISLALASATVHFKEEFDAGWEKRWVQSSADDASGAAGKLVSATGQWFGDAVQDSGVQTSTDARFYKYSAKFPKFSNNGKPLVLQYTVKHEQDLDCGGSYIKLGPSGLDQDTFTGESAYNIMFGPDKCGATNRVHFIFAYKGKNHLWKKSVTPPNDKLTHLYTAIVNPDQTYEVRIDNEVKESGNIVDDWDLLPPKEINDPDAHKPSDWVDERNIPDPEDKKPEGWDATPKEIPDPDASKPEDWDDELDGTWEVPTIPNPEYKGEWAPKMIPNPAYKGEWVHPKVPNPSFVDDPHITAYEHEYVAFEVWQVKSGTIFDHILVADSVADAEAFVTSHFATQQAKEKEVHDKAEKEREEKEEAEREEARKNMEAEGGEGDFDDDDLDEDVHDHDHDEL